MTTNDPGSQRCLDPDCGFRQTVDEVGASRSAPLLAALLVVSAAPIAAQNLLFDNGPLVTHPGQAPGGGDFSAVQDSSLGLRLLGRSCESGIVRVADQFTVTAATGWQLTDVEVMVYQRGNTTTVSTITEVHVQIWDGDPSLPTSGVVFGDPTTNRMASSTFSGIYRSFESRLNTFVDRPLMATRCTLGVTLPAGTYWLEYDARGSLTTGGPYTPFVTIVGTPVTGDAVVFNSFVGQWAPERDGTFPQGYPFKLFGSEGNLPGTEVYGAGKPGTNGVPDWNPGVPALGTSATLSVTNGLPTALPLVVCGYARANTPMPPFGTLLLAPAPGCTLLLPAFDPLGTSTTSLSIPSSVHLAGLRVDFQALFTDPAAAGGFAHTAGLEWTLN